MKNTVKITVFAIALTFVLAFSVLTVFVQAQTDDGSYADKIHSSVAKAQKNENGEKLVLVHLHVYTEDRLEKIFFEKYGFSGAEYNPSINYVDYFDPQYLEDFLKKYENVDNPEALRASLYDNRNLYRRLVTKNRVDVNNGLVEEFINRLGIDRDKIEGSLNNLPAFYILATDEEIISLAKDGEVNYITNLEGGSNEGSNVHSAYGSGNAETAAESYESEAVATDAETVVSEETAARDVTETQEKGTEETGTQGESGGEGGFPWLAATVSAAAVLCAAAAVFVFRKKKRTEKHS